MLDDGEQTTMNRNVCYLTLCAPARRCVMYRQIMPKKARLAGTQLLLGVVAFFPLRSFLSHQL